MPGGDAVVHLGVRPCPLCLADTGAPQNACWPPRVLVVGIICRLPRTSSSARVLEAPHGLRYHMRVCEALHIASVCLCTNEAVSSSTVRGCRCNAPSSPWCCPRPCRKPVRQSAWHTDRQLSLSAPLRPQHRTWHPQCGRCPPRTSPSERSAKGCTSFYMCVSIMHSAHSLSLQSMLAAFARLLVCRLCPLLDVATIVSCICLSTLLILPPGVLRPGAPALRELCV